MALCTEVMRTIQVEARRCHTLLPSFSCCVAERLAPSERCPALLSPAFQLRTFRWRVTPHLIILTYRVTGFRPFAMVRRTIHIIRMVLVASFSMVRASCSVTTNVSSISGRLGKCANQPSGNEDSWTGQGCAIMASHDYSDQVVQQRNDRNVVCPTYLAT